MTLQACVIRPKLRKPNEASIEGIQGDIIGNATIVLARRFDEQLKVRQHFLNPLRREAECPQDGEGGWQRNRRVEHGRSER